MTNIIYSGEYEDLIDWITDSYHPEHYDTFKDWLQDVKIDFDNSGHHFSDDISDEMKQVWFDNLPNRPLGFGTELPATKARNKTFNQARKLQYFTTTEIYGKNPDRPKASVRRELQELVKSGRLERIKKGVYRVK